MKLLKIFVLVCSTIVNAQSLKLGFDLEANWVRLKSGLMGGEGSPISYHLNAAYIPLNPLALQIKVGSTAMVSFTGLEVGLSTKYIFHDPFYIIVGMLYHSNTGGSGSNSWGTEYASILMLNASAGFRLIQFLSLELGFYVPTSSKVIGYSNSIYEYPPKRKTFIFKNMLRLGLIFAWEI